MPQRLPHTHSQQATCTHCVLACSGLSGCHAVTLAALWVARVVPVEAYRPCVFKFISIYRLIGTLAS